MIGRNSITKTIVVANKSNADKPYEIVVQANKNLGICDLIKGVRIPQEDPRTKKKFKKFFQIGRVNELLPKYVGRQINDESVMASLEDYLFVTLNKEDNHE